MQHHSRKVDGRMYADAFRVLAGPCSIMQYAHRNQSQARVLRKKHLEVYFGIGALGNEVGDGRRNNTLAHAHHSTGC